MFIDSSFISIAICHGANSNDNFPTRRIAAQQRASRIRQ
jgi:hypothetical protein